METLSLDKIWKFTPDPENTGLRNSWFNEPDRLLKEGRDIAVPSCWEEIEEDYEGAAWYATTVEVGSELVGQICRICFQASNYRTQVWVNGFPIGEHEGGYTPFHMQIEDALKYGASNTIIVRVISPIVTKDIIVDDLGPNDMPHWRGGLTAGIWQSVSLEFNPSAWIESAFYQPDIAKGAFTAQLDIQSGETKAIEAEIAIKLTDADGAVVCEMEETVTVADGANAYSFKLPVANPVLWDCDHPHLYTATVTLNVAGTAIAESTEKIGLRAFTFEDGGFYLNGKPIYPRGGFWEGVYAKHQSYPEDRAVIRKEIQLAKELGFNLLRPWRRPVPPMILEEADAAGLLIIASPAVECMSCWPSLRPKMARRIEDEIRGLILRDRNHPCIIWWEMFNEVTREPLAKLIPKMSHMARRLDPTRLVLDESGGWADGAHFYLPHSDAVESLAELHSYVRAPVPDRNWKLYQDLGEYDLEEGGTTVKQGGGLFVSEFGYGGWPEFEENCRIFKEQGNPLLPIYRFYHRMAEQLGAAIKACGIDDVFPTVDSLCLASQEIQARGNLRQTEALLGNRNVSGYCMHAFTDGDWIVGASLIDHWQRPKKVYYAVQEANKLPRLIAFPATRNLVPGASVAVRLVLRGVNAPCPSGISLSNGDKSVSLEALAWSEATDFRSAEIEVPASLLNAGTNEVQLTPQGVADGALSTSTLEFFVVEFPEASNSRTLVVYDPENDVTPALERRGFHITRLEDWSDDGAPATFLFVPQDVTDKAHLEPAAKAMDAVKAGRGSAIYLEAPMKHEAKWALSYYGGCEEMEPEDNQLLQSGVFPFQLRAQSSFALWEASTHTVKAHPIFDGLPQQCLMDEPYQEVAPIESFVDLEAIEKPVETITWFRPEVIATKAKDRTYLGGDDIWHGTDLAIKAHGAGSVIVSTLVLRRKVDHDPVAQRILVNLIAFAERP